jgi:hypothetical protein
MNDCTNNSADAHACKWAMPGDKCVLTGECRFEPKTSGERALATQVAGNHYKDMAIQPVEYVHKNDIGYIEGSVIKYVSRWRKKNGVEDLKKARHFLDLLIEMEQDRPAP